MTCRTVVPYLVDLARGIELDVDRRSEVDRHLRECPACAARLDDERAMSSALRRLAQDTAEPASNPADEKAVLAAFDAFWAQPRSRTPMRRWLPLAAAAILVLAATLTWIIAHRPKPAPPLAALPATEFVPWPGASSLPTFESGRLMRMELPTSMAVSLGLAPPPSQTGVVTADVLVGQDGYARAVRLAP
jgi:hypothetical protein